MEIANKRYVPRQRFAGSFFELYLDDVRLEAGIHPIRRGMEEYGGVAFNVSRLESDLGMLSLGDLKGHISLLRHSEILSFGELAEGIGAYILPDVHVWRWALLLSLACLLSEMVYLRYFYLHGKERDIDKVGTGL